MKKKLLLLLIALGLGACCACGPNVRVTDTEPETPLASAAPAPLPTPTPEKPLAVTLVHDGADASAFVLGAKQEAERMGIILEEVTADDVFAGVQSAQESGADAVIARVASELSPAPPAALSSGVPLALYYAPAALPAPAAQGYSVIYYDNDAVLSTLFNTVIEYPPHDTPVRLIALFESAESGASQYYGELFQEGKVFPKETYYLDAEKQMDASVWLKEKLGKYHEGMLDGIVAENEALALAAVTALQERGRTDIEVFCAGLSEPSIRRMLTSPRIFAAAVGANEAFAGVLGVRMAAAMAKGAPAVTEALPPCVAMSSAVTDALLLSEGFAPQDVLDKYPGAQ